MAASSQSGRKALTLALIRLIGGAALLLVTVHARGAVSPLYWTNGTGTTPSGTWGIDSFWLGTDGSHNSVTSSSWDLYTTNPGDTSGNFTIAVNGTQQANSLNVLAGTATFTGGTIASALNVGGGSTLGTALVNGSVSGTSLVNIRGTLGGSGTIGPVTVNGGELLPGTSTSIATLNTGSVNLTGVSATGAKIDLGSSPAADLLNVTGTVSLSGSLTLLLNFLNAPDPSTFGAPRTYEIVANDGNDAVSGSFPAIGYGGLPTEVNGYGWATPTIDLAFSGTDSLGRVGDGNDIAITLRAVPVPEPSAIALTGVALAALFGRRRWKRLNFASSAAHSAGTRLIVL